MGTIRSEACVSQEGGIDIAFYILLRGRREPKASLVSPEGARKLDEFRAWELVMGLLG